MRLFWLSWLAIGFASIVVVAGVRILSGPQPDDLATGALSELAFNSPNEIIDRPKDLLAARSVGDGLRGRVPQTKGIQVRRNSTPTPDWIRFGLDAINRTSRESGRPQLLSATPNPGLFFGVFQGNTCLGSIRFTNLHEKLVFIDSIRSSCSCVMTYVPSQGIAPGASVDAIALYSARNVGSGSTRFVAASFDQSGATDLSVSQFRHRSVGKCTMTPQTVAKFDDAERAHWLPISWKIELESPWRLGKSCIASHQRFADALIEQVDANTWVLTVSPCQLPADPPCRKFELIVASAYHPQRKEFGLVQFVLENRNSAAKSDMPILIANTNRIDSAQSCLEVCSPVANNQMLRFAFHAFECSTTKDRWSQGCLVPSDRLSDEAQGADCFHVSEPEWIRGRPSGWRLRLKDEFADGQCFGVIVASDNKRRWLMPVELNRPR